MPDVIACVVKVEESHCVISCLRWSQLTLLCVCCEDGGKSLCYQLPALVTPDVIACVL